MTFNPFELSIFDSSPIELFLFDREQFQTWAYTSSDQIVTRSGIDFRPIPITRGKIEQSQDIKRSNITVSVPITATLVQQYIISPPTDPINLTISRFQFDDLDNEVITLWTGRITNVSFKENTADIRCEPLDTSLDRSLLRRVYETACPHVLYELSTCGLDRDDFETPATITNVDGLDLTSPEFGVGDNFFTGGFVQLEVSGLFNKRFVIAHVGNVITVNLPITGIVSGSQVTIFPGCGHDTATCFSKFNNILNYGGQPFIPTKNPMTGTPVY